MTNVCCMKSGFCELLSPDWLNLRTPRCSPNAFVDPKKTDKQAQTDADRHAMRLVAILCVQWWTLTVAAVTGGPSWTRGIFWTRAVERLVPPMRSGTDDLWRNLTRRSKAVKMAGEDGKCGRNLCLVLEGSAKKGCARQRNNLDQIEGDIFSFHLARIMGVKQVPPTTLIMADRVTNRNRYAWRPDRPLVISEFIEDLVPAFIPRLLRASTRRLHPPDLRGINDQSELLELIQWTDLIVFDYLTANLDRAVNNLHNLQWNDGIMNAPAHNLARVNQSGLLVFLDHESGLIHGYRLIDKYEKYHRMLLDCVCVFRKSTGDVIEQFHKSGNAGELISRHFERAEAEAEGGVGQLLPNFPRKSAAILNERISYVFKQIQKCKELYPEIDR